MAADKTRAAEEDDPPLGHRSSEPLISGGSPDAGPPRTHRASYSL
jgi:hypothetical protein